MKALIATLIFLPAFLFAQENTEFVVKKKEPSFKIYYSRENIKAPELTNYLWLVSKKTCFYSSKETPTSEYNQTNIDAMLTDTLKCHTYTTTKDTIKFTVNSRVQSERSSPYTYKAYYTFFPSDSLRALHLDLYFSTDQKAGGTYNYIEFIPPKKK